MSRVVTAELFSTLSYNISKRASCCCIAQQMYLRCKISSDVDREAGLSPFQGLPSHGQEISPFKPFLECRLRSRSNCFSKVGWDHVTIVSRKSVCFTHTRVVKQVHSLSMSMQHKTCKWDSMQTCWSLKIRHDARLTRKLISGGWYADLDLQPFLCCLNLLWKPCPLSGPWQFA